MKKIKSIIGILCAFGVASVPGLTFADEEMSNGFLMSPSYTTMILMPGESSRQTVSVSNPNSATDEVCVKFSVGPFGVVETATDYSLDLDNRGNFNQIVDWIEFDFERVCVQPNETVGVPFTINVPEDAPAGGQYAIIYAQKENNKAPEGEGIAISEEIALSSIVYANVAGETNESGEILQNSIEPFSFNSVVKATSLVKNIGNTHENVEYTLQVFPLFSDEEVYTNEEKPMSAIIIPGQTYLYDATWNEAPLVGVFKAVQTIKFAGETSKVEKIVIVCPLWLLFVIVAAVIFILIWIFARNKKRKNR